MDVEPAADEIAGDAGLEIGKRQDEVGRQFKDLVNVRRGEGADPRLLAANLRWADDIAIDADDAVLLAEQIRRLDGLFGQADNSAWRKHGPCTEIMETRSKIPTMSRRKFASPWLGGPIKSH
jgi:hypothetical protein